VYDMIMPKGQDTSESWSCLEIPTREKRSCGGGT
jgi:hypothetical protein